MRSPSRRVGVSILIVLSSVAGILLLPHHHADSTAIAVQSNDVSAPGTAGLKAYLDPETGELTTGPAPASELELDAELQNALRRDDEGLEVVRHPDGSYSMDLQGRFQSVSVVTIDANGKRTICTDNVGAVENVLEGNVPAPNTAEVK